MRCCLFLAAAVLRGRRDPEGPPPGAEPASDESEIEEAREDAGIRVLQQEGKWAQNVWPYKKFAHVYVATLPRDLYRLRRTREVLKEMELTDYEVFGASDGSDPLQVPRKLLPSMHRADNGCRKIPIPGFDYRPYGTWRVGRPWVPGEQEATLGCYLTHLRMLQDAMQHGYESVLIFEDDLDPRYNAAERFKMVRHLPNSWDMVYLGWYRHEAGTTRRANLYQSLPRWDCTPYGHEGLCKLKGPYLQQTHALAINGKALGPLVEFLEGGLNQGTACAVDQMYRAFQIKHPEFQVFASSEPLFGQMSAADKWPSQITPYLVVEADDERSPKEKLQDLLFGSRRRSAKAASQESVKEATLRIAKLAKLGKSKSALGGSAAAQGV